MRYHGAIDISILNGKHIKDVDIDEYVIVFNMVDGEKYWMGHIQDCCESVTIDDITEGAEYILNDSLVVNAYESESEPCDDDLYYHESHTWTFYRINTTKGTVVIKWYGCSNGYYSESVDFRQL